MNTLIIPGRCATCRHWRPIPKMGPHLLGNCNAISTVAPDAIGALQAEIVSRDPAARLRTRPAFTCSLWEQNE